MVMDPEILFAENLVEKKHTRMMRNQRRGDDRDLKPNPAIRDQLTNLTKKPPTQMLEPDEKDLIWRFRHYLCRDKRALAKFVQCVDWLDAAEATQATDLLEQWEPMDVDDALELLGPSFTASPVRAYAVSRLEDAADSDLILYLLQLVQALKYEPIQKGASAGDDDAAGAVVLPEDEGGEDEAAASAGAGGVGASAGPAAPIIEFAPRSLGGFLIRRALLNNAFGNYLFWYVWVECNIKENPSSRLYAQVYRAFVHALENGNAEQQAQKAQLKRQRVFMAGLRNLTKDIKAAPGNRVKKIGILKEKLTENDGFLKIEPPMPLPLDPEVFVTGIIPEKAYMFKSALCPLLLTFQTTTNSKYSIIYKLGDDLRQDQLILQIIMLMDKLLKKENLDLKLTPYQVLATSSEIGMLQCVPDSTALASLFKDFGSIRNFLKNRAPDASAPNGISREAMDNYIKSCAGYCVITYLLGIGDRHFDNLMITDQGHMFHIDFGFILGRDPKPYPPPMKLTKEMLEAMGGANGEDMPKFRSHCYNAFLILRKHANLILNLFALMVESGVQDIAMDPDKTVGKVQEKFLLELGEEEAVERFQALLDESVSAMFAVFVERIHSWAQYWRK
jgi:phosphatidylinositol 3-kinase